VPEDFVENEIDLCPPGTSSVRQGLSDPLRHAPEALS
jgi:hypothetical protein